MPFRGRTVAFTFVNVAALATCVRMRRDGGGPSPLSYVVAPAAGAVVDLYLLYGLDGKAPTPGPVRPGLGVAHLTCLTRMFRRVPRSAAGEVVHRGGRPLCGGEGPRKAGNAA
ncbi:hypothetical protein [Streptomyces altiplanensis]